MNYSDVYKSIPVHKYEIQLIDNLTYEEAKAIAEKLDHDIRLQLVYIETRLPKKITPAKEEASFILQYDMNVVCEGNIDFQRIGKGVIFH